jgi:hypothetical protein
MDEPVERTQQDVEEADRANGEPDATGSGDPSGAGGAGEPPGRSADSRTPAGHDTAAGTDPEQ